MNEILDVAEKKYKLVFVDEISRTLGVVPWTVRKFLRNGRLIGGKIGRRWAMTQWALDQYINETLKERKA